MSYEEFDYGELISSDKLNSNYAALSQDITTSVSTLQTSINTLNNTVTSLSNTVTTISTKVASLSPIGTVIWYANDTKPDGYLICDGSAISRTDYADLFAVISTTFGVGDGSTTFNLPDLIDKFIEGSDTVGTYYEAGLPQHTHSFTAPDFLNMPRGDDRTGCVSYATTGTTGDASNPIYGNSDTVQPPALTLLPCIKY